MTAAPEPVTLDCPRPVARPVMLQGWRDLASIHWSFDPEVVQRILPAGLRVDTFDGRAWVGVLPFHMRRIRIPGLPALGRQSTFPETNVRTYVVGPDGRRAVWFCSLDITRLAATVVARVTYGLPYCWAAMSIEHRVGPDGPVVAYRSARRWPRTVSRRSGPDRPGGAGPTAPSTRVEVAVGAAIPDADQSPLERFVSARWALASTHLGMTLWADVDHGPWPLYRARLLDLDESLVTAAGFPAPSGEPLVLWSPGVEVRIGRPRRIA